jgi:hypothetical protein
MQASQPVIAASNKPYRISALDFTKGMLVLIMVLYHWINYFYGSHDNRYLRFLTPSFIFIAGFLISNIYISKYGLSDPHMPKRLVQRGLKILAVFFVLNMTRGLLLGGGFQQQLSSGSLIDIYLMGTGVGGGQSKAVAFFILVPISYLLMLSALLIVVARFYRYTFYVAGVCFLVGVALLSYEGIESPNLELLTVGLLGVIAGYLPIEKVNALARHSYMLVAAYAIYLGVISVWIVDYPIQIIGVVLSLLIIYRLGLHSGEPGKVRACIVLLGKYSLVGYIAQIAILQALRIALNQVDSEVVARGLSFILAFALTIISVEVLDWIRAKSTTMDWLYKAVFA